jgi:hypothetical protein
MTATLSVHEEHESAFRDFFAAVRTAARESDATVEAAKLATGPKGPGLGYRVGAGLRAAISFLNQHLNGRDLKDRRGQTPNHNCGRRHHKVDGGRRDAVAGATRLEIAIRLMQTTWRSNRRLRGGLDVVVVGAGDDVVPLHDLLLERRGLGAVGRQGVVAKRQVDGRLG